MDNNEKCVRCGEVGEDRRTLKMACFYEMKELGLPFEDMYLFWADPKELEKASDPVSIDISSHGKPRKLNLVSGTVRTKGELTPEHLYTLRVCKDCRASWMTAIQQWFQSGKKTKSCGSGIYIRRNGATVEISEKEWYDMHPDQEPVRLRESEK